MSTKKQVGDQYAFGYGDGYQHGKSEVRPVSPQLSVPSLSNLSNTTKASQHDAKCGPKSTKSQAALAKEQTKLFREFSLSLSFSIDWISELEFLLTGKIQSSLKTI